MCERAHLKKIAALCGRGNAPDMKDYLFVTTMNDIKSIPPFDSNTWRIGQNIEMTPPNQANQTPKGKWERWEVARTDNGYSSGRKDNYYEPKFEFFIEELNEIKTFILAKARGQKLAVLAIDNNGKKRLMTDADLMFDEQTKSKNGYKIEFSCGQIPDPLPFYEGEIDEE